MEIRENMPWPPMDYLYWKMAEHSAWYSGDPNILANFYANYEAYNFTGLPRMLPIKEMFWARVLSNKNDTFVHVPIAGDIAAASANYLFSEPPLVKITDAYTAYATQDAIKAQDELNNLLIETQFNRKNIEAAEACAAIGGVYYKIAWDKDISDYPIIVIEQADHAIPTFKFGTLQKVIFWKNILVDSEPGKNSNTVYRLLEIYEVGKITNKLYKGSTDRLGKEVSLDELEETKELQPVITHVDELLAVYVPNILPNKLDRNSYLGHSDLLGIEYLMDALDQTFSSWIKDIKMAQARILLPESWLKKTETGDYKFNIDKSLYVALDIDPVTANEKGLITPQQFDIRSQQFEQTAINLMERIITSAGYSPQSFGLNIEGRAESGTALNIRERKSYLTKNKKQAYWGPALKRLIYLLQRVYNEEFGGKMNLNYDITIEFGDTINNIDNMATSVKMLSDAIAVSIETKVRLLHPEWSEKQILEEVRKIKEENGISLEPPEGNLDVFQKSYIENIMDEIENVSKGNLDTSKGSEE